jgi:carboxylesterase
MIVMSTPTRFAGGWQIRVLPLARYFIKWFYLLATLDYNNPNPDIIINFADPKVLEQIKRAIQLPVSAIDELVRLTNKGRKRLGLVRSPLLIIHSKKDQTVSPLCAEELYQLASAASPKSLHWFERSDHVITLGPEKEEVYQLVTTFIEATVHAAVKTALPGAAHLDEVDETFPGH